MTNSWDREPWAPLDGEPHPDFELFVAYRTLGMTRSLGKAAALTGKSPQTLKEKSQKWAWVERAEAWDIHVDESVRKEFKQELVETRKRVVAMATTMQQKIAQRLMDLKPEELSPRDLITWMDISTKLQLKALGEADQKVEITGADGQPLQLASEMTAEARAKMMAELAADLAGMLPAEPEIFDADVVEQGELEA